uniref:C-type lectin domain-containing protein n=1 Tax=Ditylenchus dipsaci TaxID=166011 RepID=A0A915EFV6_9BILA
MRFSSNYAIRKQLTLNFNVVLRLSDNAARIAAARPTYNDLQLIYDMSKFNGSCFFFPHVKYNPIRNQSDARDICLQNGGDLPSFHSAEEHEFFKGLLLPKFNHWLGMVLTFENTDVNSTVATVRYTDNSLVDWANPMAPDFRVCLSTF